MEQIKVSVETRKINVEVYAPEREHAPGVLLLHELYGVRDWYRDDAEDLRRRGYLVYVPDLFTGGALRYCIRSMVLSEGRENREDSGVNREIHALLDALKADPRCDGKLGMLGACLSGGFVIQMARRSDMIAPVVYHHSLGLDDAGVPASEALDEVTRLQGHWASRDIFCPRQRRERLQERLGAKLERYEYNMRHGFRSISRDHPASAVVWARTLRFFDEHLMCDVEKK